MLQELVDLRKNAKIELANYGIPIDKVERFLRWQLSPLKLKELKAEFYAANPSADICKFNEFEIFGIKCEECLPFDALFDQKKVELVMKLGSGSV